MQRRIFTVTLLLIMLASMLAACGGQQGTTTPGSQATAAPDTQAISAPAAEATAAPAGQPSASGKTQLKLWTHSAGNDKEIAVLKEEIAGFNSSQDEYEVVYEAFPQASDNDSVAAASV